MAKMTKNRAETNIPIGKIGSDKIMSEDPLTKVVREYVLVSEREIKDENGNIIGVEKIWQ